MNEDKLTNTLIEFYHKDDDGRTDRDPETVTVPEAVYNNYGQRGFVDLYAVGISGSHLYEIKSDSALSAATGANEIIRQFNRMRNNFFQGSQFDPSDTVRYELTFLPSPRTVDHVERNRSLYREMTRTPVPSPSGVKTSATRVAFRIPNIEELHPVFAFTENDDLSDLLNMYGGDEHELTTLADLIEYVNPAMATYLNRGKS